MVTDTLPSSNDATDVCRWVDTDCMSADALTKQMSPEKLVAAIDTNTWSLEQPIESIVRKRDKQRQRAAGRNQQKEKKEQQVRRQLNETRAEVMGSSDPESRDDDGPGAQGDEDRRRRSLGYWENVVGRVPDGPTTSDSSTCAAGE